ncbi:hypothetical protein TrLO_g15803 [Triparma laevis f. longispina]|uniref:Peptidase S54 rhomboid domain-containing protein n=1 Tax=Triparma laevis f. longispina TaxID=1714387 RepID=A0A9W6ZSP6_9STRA|nr:hypothetical protein TrLO_g15803 [Triparma laevis f. longispina]
MDPRFFTTSKPPLQLSLTFRSPLLLTFTFLSLLPTLFNLKDTLSLLPLKFYPSYPTTRWLRLVTWPCAHMDSHHFFHNFKMILLLGPATEEKYGSVVLGVLMLVNTLACCCFHFIFSQNTSVIGASGILFMLIGLNICNTYAGGKSIPLTFLLTCLMFLGEELWLASTRDDRVSRMTHVSGGVVGVVAGIFWNRRKKKTKRM